MKYTNEKRKELDLILESIPRKSPISGNVCGIGVNDSIFQVRMDLSGECVIHSAYEIWRGMLRRCNSKESIANRPTYSDVSVCNEWLGFRSFHSWYKQNVKYGMAIDKDMLSGNEKIYSPETCVFVPIELNSFVTLRGNARGPYPIGVTKVGRKFRSRVNDGNGNKLYLGDFPSQEKAHAAWLSAKLSMAINYKPLCDTIHPELYSGLVSLIKRESENSLK